MTWHAGIDGALSVHDHVVAQTVLDILQDASFLTCVAEAHLFKLFRELTASCQEFRLGCWLVGDEAIFHAVICIFVIDTPQTGHGILFPAGNEGLAINLKRGDVLDALVNVGDLLVEQADGLLEEAHIGCATNEGVQLVAQALSRRGIALAGEKTQTQ